MVHTDLYLSDLEGYYFRKLEVPTSHAVEEF